ncbi:hypothetical protein WN72_39615 [Bradyrhizobium arachidis]|uniref:Uncharacterized protein n=1 Tax=Bradyrhizobium arachidis TaxID=858423 RepID=A0AAE7TL25_9BRAD|nr:hypothetical protein WN72_39615 [Bradyrhizobium arachidis]
MIQIKQAASIKSCHRPILADPQLGSLRRFGLISGVFGLVSPADVLQILPLFALGPEPDVLTLSGTETIVAFAIAIVVRSQRIDQ